MIDKLIKELNNSFVGIPYLLDDGRIEEAEKELAEAAKNLQEFMGYTVFLTNYEKLAQSFLERFVEISMTLAFLSTYRWIDAYNNAVVNNDPVQEADLLQKIDHKVTFMREAYLEALNDGRGQTAPFIDFGTDFPRLLMYLQQSAEKANLHKMCNNFKNAMNFQDQLFSFFPSSRNSSLAYPQQMLGTDLEKESEACQF
ncbi:MULTISPECIES: hypothetical protein [Legionella]|uniref:Uncharacterized protein n=1 Tax=Legionella drozanskii LLAP-1 TaxID=1212489 RepID=A0A0W0SWQ8_9GAMM|nr:MULTISPECIES: hypothetical protein [Legionella]KTC87693.1 hypothetical protein Ldro_1312 [Legionella drozanskii LLAP-1]PJE16227.1 MAG: hypothetical protein CK430_03340 [Legionella sp.]